MGSVNPRVLFSRLRTVLQGVSIRIGAPMVVLAAVLWLTRSLTSSLSTSSTGRPRVAARTTIL